MELVLQDFEGLSVGNLLGGFNALPSLVQRLEHEIGVRMRRTNIHLDTFMEGTGKALDWLTGVSLKAFAPRETAIWRLDPWSGALTVAAFRPAENVSPNSLRREVRDTLSQVVRLRAGVRFDPSSSGRLTAMATPMILGERLIGAVHVEAADDEFEEEDLGTLSFLVEVFTLSCFLTTHAMKRHSGDITTGTLNELADSRRVATGKGCP